MVKLWHRLIQCRNVTRERGGEVHEIINKKAQRRMVIAKLDILIYLDISRYETTSYLISSISLY